LRVRVKIDFALLVQGRQRMDRRAQFHPVVRGRRLSPGNFPLELSMSQDGCPTARPRISLARSVAVNPDLFQLSW
jgi:ABC-type taurine transport system ATPase subunit